MAAALELRKYARTRGVSFDQLLAVVQKQDAETVATLAANARRWPETDAAFGVFNGYGLAEADVVMEPEED